MRRSKKKFYVGDLVMVISVPYYALATEPSKEIGKVYEITRVEGGVYHVEAPGERPNLLIFDQLKLFKARE